MKLEQTLQVLVMLGDNDAILVSNLVSQLKGHSVKSKRDGRLAVVNDSALTKRGTLRKRSKIE